MNDKKQRRDFTDEFKTDAVKLVLEQGYNASSVSKRYRQILHSYLPLQGPQDQSVKGSPQHLED